MINGYWIPHASEEGGKIGFIRLDHISAFITDRLQNEDVLRIYLIGGETLCLRQPWTEFLDQYETWRKSRAPRLETLENAAVSLMETADNLQKDQANGKT
jgi:hypothetical protein